MFLWTDGEGRIRLDAAWPDGLYLSVITDGETATVDTDNQQEAAARVGELHDFLAPSEPQAGPVPCGVAVVWVIAGVALLLMEAAGILLGGLVSGGWMWGLLWAGVAVAAMVGWLQLRGSNQPAQVVADRMIAGTTVALLGLAMRGFHEIEAWLHQ